MTESADTESESSDEKSLTKESAIQIMLAMQEPKDKLLKHVKKMADKHENFGLDVFTTEVDGWTPFHAAVLRGSKRILKSMLATGVDVNLRMGKPNGLPAECTALHIAAHRGDKKIVNYLLSRGAHINLKDSENRPPLYYAAAANHLQAVKILLQFGAEVQQSGVNLCDKNLRPLPRLSREFSLVDCAPSEHA